MNTDWKTLCPATLNPDAPGEDGYTDVLIAGDGLYPRYLPGEVALVETNTPPDIGEDCFLTMTGGETIIARLIAVDGDDAILASVNNTRLRARVRQAEIENAERIQGRISPPPAFSDRPAAIGHASPTLH